MRFDQVSEEESIVSDMCEALQGVGYKFPLYLVGMEGLRTIAASVKDLVRRVKDAEKTPNEERFKMEREARGDA